MPKQFYIIALVLLLWFWPWQLFSGDLPADWLLSAITMQLVFVIACNILTNESWAIAITIIEGVCMLFNVLIVLIGAPISLYHDDIMLAAFILELLIITISLQGVAVGGSSGNRISLAGSSLWASRSSLHSLQRGKEALS